MFSSGMGRPTARPKLIARGGHGVVELERRLRASGLGREIRLQEVLVLRNPPSTWPLCRLKPGRDPVLIAVAQTAA